MDMILREALTDNQVYLGIQLADLQLLDKYAAPDARPAQGFYTDFSGVRTRLSFFGIDSHPGEQHVGRIPFPDDALHAEAIEYIAALVALEQARDSFTVVELGAGYGPWLVFAAKAAQQRGIAHINLLAVEADLQRHELFFTNLRDNGLPLPADPVPAATANASNVQVRCIHGAIADVDGKLSFGSQSLLDWGAAPITDGGTEDYRGITVEAEEIDAYSIGTVLADLAEVDFMHMDIQGFELKAIRAALDALQRKVRVLLVATHSRALEGGIIDLLHDNGWKLLYEKPCKFTPGSGIDLTALTYLDGTQVWVNTRFGSPAQPQSAVEQPSAHPAECVHKQRLDAVYRSTSWRITGPIRWLKTQLTG
ncbi:FkbM family methyltransferase [Pseudomonas sp. NPDC089752]|uniref:FkbM family methyltransferase n=1 Tax=Pseudomonas sp. NPDC089752 TaxID=3364472 RepID=UPI0038064DAC